MPCNNQAYLDCTISSTISSILSTLKFPLRQNGILIGISRSSSLVITIRTMSLSGMSVSNSSVMSFRIRRNRHGFEMTARSNRQMRRSNSQRRQRDRSNLQIRRSKVQMRRMILWRNIYKLTLTPSCHIKR